MEEQFDFSIFRNALILLGVGGLIVPLLYRFKVSPILGFLAAGLFLGPYGLGNLAEDFPQLRLFTFTVSEEIEALADLGVVFLLFIVGLELNLQRLIAMRRLVFGLGTAQIVLSAAAVGGIAYAFKNPASTSIVIGLALAVSSTAIIVDLLSRQHRLSSTTGRTSFSILLMQDIAVIPMLFLIESLSKGADDSLLSNVGEAFGQAIIAVALIVLLGRIILRPFFRLVAATPNQELFLAGTLLIIMLTGVAAASAGLSMALGAFIAGILLSETEYRRAIESAIDPFKGLLLGVFFFTVGLAIELDQIIAHPVMIGLSVTGLVAVKAAIFAPLARMFGIHWSAAIKSAFLLGAGGEFAFVIIGLAARSNVMDREVSGFMLSVTALTMALIPVLDFLGRVVSQRWEAADVRRLKDASETTEDEEFHALVVGFGRVGTLVSGLLKQNDIPHLIVEQDPVTVERGRKLGRKVHYGNVKDVAFLRSLGIDQVKTVILTIDDADAADSIVQTVREVHPNVPIIARARDGAHARKLYAQGVTEAVPETIEASLQLSEAALLAHGLESAQVTAAIDRQRAKFQNSLRSGSEEAN